MDHSHERTKKWLAAGIAACLGAAACFTAGYYARLLAFDGRTRSLLWAIETAESRYYKEVDEDKLFEDLFSAFGLDPYSGYYPKVEYEEQMSADAGNRAGVGVSVSNVGGTAVLYSVYGNSPAEHAGLRTGMTIFGVGSSEEEIASGTPAELASKLQSSLAGEPLYVRCGFEEGEVYEVVPGSYRTSYCLYADADGAVRFDPATLQPFSVPFETLPLPEHTAYIRLTSFRGTAAEEMKACLTRMREGGNTNLILDLRSNGGGAMDIASKIAGLFAKDAQGKSPIVATARYRSGYERNFRAPENTYYDYFTQNSRIRVLADAGTASASECLIGSMISYGTVTEDDLYIVDGANGARTYGKGIMQSYYFDGQGNSLKLTVAEIFWPNGTSIHGKGIFAVDEAHAVPYDGIPREHDAFLSEFFARITLA